MGGFAEIAAVPAKCAIALPDDTDAALGALIEPMAVGRHATRIAGIAPGDEILVIGGGTIALSVIIWARRVKAGRIAVVLRSGRRADLARETFPPGDPRVLSPEDTVMAKPVQV